MIRIFNEKPASSTSSINLKISFDIPPFQISWVHHNAFLLQFSDETLFAKNKFQKPLLITGCLNICCIKTGI